MNISRVERDKKRRKLFKRYESKRVLYKAISNNLNLPLNIRLEAQEKLNKLPRNSSPIRIRNRCVLTGRPRGVLRKFKLSRIKFQELALSGNIPGVFKL